MTGTAYFVEPDGHGDLTLWRHWVDPENSGDPRSEDPHPVVRKVDLPRADREFLWGLLLAGLDSRVRVTPRLGGRS